MTQKLKTIPLIGYSDRLSVRPEETISFKVSSENSASYTASLFRSYSSDPNPKGVGIFEESAEKFFHSYPGSGHGKHRGFLSLQILLVSESCETSDREAQELRRTE